MSRKADLELETFRRKRVIWGRKELMMGDDALGAGEHDRSEEVRVQQCDLLIRNGFVITMNEERAIFARGAIAVDGQTIVAVGPDREVAPRFAPTRTIEASGAPVHPGFYDCHAHVTLHTTRGAFPDTPNVVEYYEHYARWMNALEPEDEFAATQLACLEMARNGVTCFLDPGTTYEPDAAAKAAEKVGIRGSVGEPFLWDAPGDWMATRLKRVPPNTKRALGLLGTELKRNKDPRALVRGHVALYGGSSASEELEVAAKATADAGEAILTQHQSFAREDAEADDKRFGSHALIHLAEIGVLDQNCTFAHMNVVRDDEMHAVVASGMSIAWVPANYMNWGAGGQFGVRIAELHRRGVGVAPGSDVAKVWPFGDQSFVGYLVVRAGGDSLSAEDLLEMATIGGAKAVGLQDWSGSLEPGKRADIVIRRNDLPEVRPGLDPIRDLVMVGRTKAVDTVLVDGTIVVEKGRATLVDEEEVYAAAARSARGLQESLGIRNEGSWPIFP